MPGFLLIPPSGVDTETLDAAVAAAVDAIDVDAQVAQALEDHSSGIFLGGASRTTAFASAGNADISTFTATVVGKGRPAIVYVKLPAVYNSTNALNGIRLDLKQDGVGICRAFAYAGSTALGNTVEFHHKTATLVLDQTYNFTIGLWQLGTGTMNVFASATGPTPMTIDVVSC